MIKKYFFLMISDGDYGCFSEQRYFVSLDTKNEFYSKYDFFVFRDLYQPMSTIH